MYCNQLFAFYAPASWTHCLRKWLPAIVSKPDIDRIKTEHKRGMRMPNCLIMRMLVFWHFFHG